MKKYKLSKPEEYTTKNGETKTFWHNVGEMIEFPKEDGSVSRIVKIPAIGLEARVFEDKPKEAQPAPQEPSVQVDDTGAVPEDSIPF